MTLLALAGALLAPGPCQTPTPELLAEFNTQPYVAPDPGGVLGTAGGRLWFEKASGFPFFTPDPPSWSLSDLSEPGTALAPLTPSGAQTVELVGPLDATRAVLAVRDGFNSNAVWAFDSVSESSVELIGSGNGLLVQDIVARNGFAYIAGRIPELSGPQTFQLWSTDGTPAGTQLLDSYPLGGFTGAGFVANASDGRLAATGNGVLFLLNRGLEIELRRVANPSTPSALVFSTSSANNAAPSWTADNDRLLFTNVDATTGAEPWITDGTAAGTRLLLDVNPGSDSSNPVFAVGSTGTLYFSARTDATGREMWATDGSTAGTRLLPEPTPGPTGSVGFPLNHVGVDSNVLFLADAPGTGEEFWFSDGTAAGTRLIGELEPGPASVQAVPPLRSGDGLAAVRVESSLAGSEIVVFDGSAGTLQLVDAVPGPAGSFASSGPGSSASFGFFDGRAVFIAGPDGLQLWLSDGTPAGTQQKADVFDVQETFGSEPTSAVAVAIGQPSQAPGSERIVVRVATDGGLGFAGTDGTPSGTELLFEQASGGPLLTSEFLPFAGNYLFWRSEPSTGSELWFTDATAAGTRRVLDLVSGPGSSGPGRGFQLGNRFVFSARTAETGRELWTTDGTEEGTQLVADLNPGTGSSSPFFLGRIADRLLFRTTDGALLPEGTLYSTDGTPEGTELVTLLPAGNPNVLAEFDGRIYFRLFVSGEQQLWRTDGTAAGTESATSFAPGLAGEEYDLLVEIEDALLVLTSDKLFGLRETGQVEQLLAGDVQSLIRVGPFGYFTATSAFPGPPLTFRTDGTPGGTVWVPAMPLGAVGSDGSALAESYSSGAGYVPQLLDGATAQLTDLPATDPTGTTRILPVARIGDRLLVQASDGDNGGELYSYDLADLGAYVVEPYGFGCGLVGTPTLDVEGALRVGESVDLELEGAAPGAAALLYAGQAPASIPLDGCTVLLQTLSLFATATTDGVGALSLPVQLPSDPAWIGRELWIQGATIAPGGPLLGALELTSALELVFGK